MEKADEGSNDETPQPGAPLAGPPRIHVTAAAGLFTASGNTAWVPTWASPTPGDLEIMRRIATRSISQGEHVKDPTEER